MKFELKIGILGAPINNTNLGCQALSFSLINLLYRLAEYNKVQCKFVIFEYIEGESKLHLFCKTLSLDETKFEHVHTTAFGEIRSYVKHPFNNIFVLNKLKGCDCVIDLTEGDSFTDIYGKRRFVSLTRQKDIICNMKIPLILGPQTYGPFNEKNNAKYAGKVINKARIVMSRDYTSAKLIEELTGKIVPVTTDLAFQLPYEKKIKSKSKRLKVGFNISGLLVESQIEKNDKAFILKTNYDTYVERVLDYLTTNSKYDIYLIPHVKEDIVAIKKFHEIYPETIVVEMFETPIQAKSLIAEMDIFIGSRMHATIAAFTSGVLTIPVAYSRKFEGLFSVVDYPFVIDLCRYNTNEAFMLTKKYFEDREYIEQKFKDSQKISKEYSVKTEKLFDQIFKRID